LHQSQIASFRFMKTQTRGFLAESLVLSVTKTRIDPRQLTPSLPSVLRCFRKQYLWFKREVFMNLLDMVKGQMTDSVMQQLGAASGLGAGDVSKAMGAIIPTQLSAIVKHGSTPQGAEGLMGMLGGLGNLGDFAGMLGQTGGAASIAKIGSSLLPSLFGNQLGGVVSGLASATGLGSGPLNMLMGLAGPLVMGQLGKAVTGGGLNAAGLASMLGGMAPQVSSMLPAGLGNILGGLGGLGALAGAAGNIGNIAGAATGALGNLTGAASGHLGDAAKAAGAIGAAGAGLAGAATSGLGGAVSGAASSLGSVAAPVAAKGGMGWLVPAIIGLLAVGGLGWFFTRPAAPAPVVETPAVEAPATDTMASGTEGAMAACTKTFTLGVKDGDTVTNNFPFGGEGEGKGYAVTVTRLDVQPRVIGTKMLPLDADCKYGYDSIPGKGKVQYDVRPMDAAADSTPIQTLTLTVN
jgi:hypothetical protein